jgi:conjugative transfer region lipoprotein (TIGR03751 family)
MFKFIWINFFIALSLTGCASVSGNVVPKSGPKMELVYDSMQADDNKNIENIRTDYQLNQTNQYRQSGLKDFKKIPNPELKLYVYPHFAGQEQMSVPGYYTVFNGYERGYFEIKG